MEMDNVLTSFQMLCDDPLAWAITAAVALRAAWSVVGFRMCPVFNGDGTVDSAEARRQVHGRFRHSPRFLITMLVGLALAVGGLYAMREATLGPAALAAMVLGAFLLATEPARFKVEEDTLRVALARAEGDESLSLASDRLRSSHLERIGIEVAVAALLLAVVTLY